MPQAAPDEPEACARPSIVIENCQFLEIGPPVFGPCGGIRLEGVTFEGPMTISVGAFRSVP